MATRKAQQPRKAAAKGGSQAKGTRNWYTDAMTEANMAIARASDRRYRKRGK